jgi:hypothetical protein
MLKSFFYNGGKACDRVGIEGKYVEAYKNGGKVCGRV